jgi:hypothetical protein
MKTFDDVVRTLGDYVKSHQMSEEKTQIALDFVMSRLSMRGTSALCLDNRNNIQFKPSFRLEIEAVLRGVSQQTH